MSSHWPSLLLFLVGNIGIVTMCYCRRRIKRKRQAEQERLAAARIVEAIRNRQKVRSGSAEQTPRERKERLAHLLVSGTVLQNSPDEMTADFGSGRTLCLIVSCAICLAEYTHGEAIMGSNNCRHVFHAKCLMKWLGKSQECPCCRTGFGDVEQGQQAVSRDLPTPTTSTSTNTTSSTTTPLRASAAGSS